MDWLLDRKLVIRLRSGVLRDGRQLNLALIGLIVLLAGGVGALLAFLSPVWGIAVMAAGVAGLMMLRDLRWSLFALLGIAFILPFASLPFKIGFTPTFLDLVLMALYLVWGMRLITRRQSDFVLTPVGVPVLIWIGLVLFAFVLGLRHSRPSSNDLRRFAEMVMGFGLFFVAVNCVRNMSLLRQVTAAMILAGAAESVLGIGLYVIPTTWTIRLLGSLGRLGYPTGAGIIRYIADDPERPMRAIGTSVDPNILGAVLIVVIGIAAAQVFSERPVLPRWIVAGALAAMGICLFLTYSRSSMLGAAVAMGLIALARYRRLIWVMLVAALLLLFLPQTQAYMSHFVQGVQIRDLSTLMRMGEYKDTFRLIARYPWLGVGFAGTPDIDLYVGVASVYFKLMAQMGIVGLLSFLAVMGAWAGYGLAAWRRTPANSEWSPFMLGYGAAIAGSLVAGLLDHTLLTYSHAVALLWLVLGLGATAIYMAGQDKQKIYIQSAD